MLPTRDRTSAAPARSARSVETPTRARAGRPPPRSWPASSARGVAAKRNCATGLPRRSAAPATRRARSLDEAIEHAPKGSFGWILPVEPALVPLRGTPAFDRVLARVAERAR